MLSGCAPEVYADPLAMVTDDPTIVSLNPCTDAILAEISSPEQVLALSHYSRDPRASSMDANHAREFGVTGGTVEEVLALDPDIVVASAFMPPATRNALTDLGVRVETFGIAQSVDESVTQIRALAEIAGQEERGEELVASIKSALDRTHASEGSAAIPTVLWQPGGIVPGESALVSELMAHTGFFSHSANGGLQQADFLSLERLLSDPPEMLLVAGQERSQRHPALDALPQMRRAAFDASLLYCSGPTIIRAVERLQDLRRDVGAEKAPPPTPSSEEEGAFKQRAALLPLLFRGGGRGVVEAQQPRDSRGAVS